MGQISPQAENQLRQVFKSFNRFMLILWQLGLGTWFKFFPKVSGQVMVITHSGRKSSVKHRTPVNYAMVNGEIYCTAAFGARADWYRNIQANPDVEVWLPDGWYAGTAEDVSSSPNRLFLMRQVLIGSGFAAYLFGVPPNIPDERLANLTENYRLIHIRLKEPRTGSGGPGDLAWIWPLATFILLPLALKRCKRGKCN